MDREEQARQALDTFTELVVSEARWALTHTHGTSGICVDCGEPIEKKRLKALPTAQRCIGCQQLLEASSAPGK